MVDDSTRLALLKDQLACEQAARDIATAQLATLQAQQQMQSPFLEAAASKVRTDAQTAALNQVKAAADAKTAAVTADSATIRAQFGNVTGSSLTGDVTVAAGAGNAEASLLAAQAMQEAAGRIAEAVRTHLASLPAHPKILIFPKMSLIVPHWRWFRLQIGVISDAFEIAKQFAAQAETLANPPKAPIDAALPLAALGPAAILTGASAALDVGAKLGSYFQTNYAIAGNTVTGSDDAALALCVAGLIADSAYPACWTPPGTPSDITALLEPLSAMRLGALMHLAQLKSGSLTVAAQAANEPDAVKQRHCKDLCAAYDQATDACNAALKGFDDFVKALAADKDGVPVAALVCDEAFIARQLETGALALLVRLNMSAGANYTKKNLWSFFGGMPFYVMGGAVASFLLVDGPSGVVKASGQFPIHGGYCKVGNVAREFSPQSKASPAPREPP